MREGTKGLHCGFKRDPEERMIRSELQMLMDFSNTPPSLRHLNRVALAKVASAAGSTDASEASSRQASPSASPSDSPLIAE